jgi:hypothetical protein
MPDIGTWLGQHWDSTEHAVSEDFRWFGDLAERAIHGGHPYATQAPAAQPVNLTAAPAATQEEPMSLLDTIRNDIAEVEAKLKDVDEAALGKLNAVMAHPEASVVLNDLAGLASIVGIPEGTIAGVAAGLKTVLSLYAQPAQPQQPEPAVTA